MSIRRHESQTPVLFGRFQRRLTPARIISLSFLAIIIVGGLLLLLPISQQPNVEVAPVDAFFTAVSAVCVTGLVTVVTASTWSVFGKLIIMLLIQIGGLSLITIFTFFLINIGRKISLKNRLAIQAATNNLSLGGMVRLVLLVIKGSFICETIGAAVLFASFLYQGVAWPQALFYGVFHAVSAFCNAGFDIIGDNSLMPYVGDFSINIVIMLLIVIGGIGFVVWRDVLTKLRFSLSKQTRQKYHISLHSKLALIVTSLLLLSGTIFFFLVEGKNPETLAGLPLSEKLLASAFQSVTLRTAGFATIAQGGLSEVAKFFSSMFMLVGGSPGGTAGGMKTVTLAIIFLGVWSLVRGRRRIVAFERSISALSLQKALTVVVLMLALLFVGTGILLISERTSAFPHSMADIVFEVSSALGTVGLTTGITPYLSLVGKLDLMLCMFIGRIGPITLIISLTHKKDFGDEVLAYPSEDVIIG